MSIHEQPPGSGGPEQEEIQRLRAEVARLERERDDARKAPPRPARSHPGLARRIVAMVLVVLTAVLALAAVPAMYLRSELIDTDRYVATVAPLASDPAIQAEIADKVTQQITDAVDFKTVIEDALNELGKTAPRVAAVITGLAPAIAEQTKNLIHTAVSRFVATPQFQGLWVQVNRVAHQGLVNLATGNTGGTVSIDQSGTVTISTKEIIAQVKSALVQQGVGIAARIPDVDAQITLFQSPELVRATNAIRTLDATAPILAWLTVITAAGAIAVAPSGRKRSTISGVGLAVAIAMALLALGLVIGRSVLLNSIPPDSVTPAAAQSLVETLLVPLRNSLRLVFAVGLIIAVAAFLGGHSRPAEFVRHGLASAGDYITGKVGAGQAQPWQLWLARYRRILEATIVGIAVLVLIFWQDPTAAVAIWTAILAVLVILLVELLCRPAVAPGTGGEPSAVEPAPAGGPPAGGPTAESRPTIPIGGPSGDSIPTAKIGSPSGESNPTAKIDDPPDETHPTAPIR